MAKQPKFTRADIEEQAKALKIDPAFIKMLVDFLMSIFGKLFLGRFMQFQPGDKAAKPWVNAVLHIHKDATR